MRKNMNSTTSSIILKETILVCIGICIALIKSSMLKNIIRNLFLCSYVYNNMVMISSIAISSIINSNIFSSFIYIRKNQQVFNYIVTYLHKKLILTLLNPFFKQYYILPNCHSHVHGIWL